METAIVQAEVITTPVHPNQRMYHESLYRAEYSQQLVEYFESAPLMDSEPELPEDAPRTGKGSLKAITQALCAEVPTFHRFAARLGVSLQTFSEWKKRHPDWAEAYTRAKAAQELHFIVGLSRGTMNPTGAIFVAKNILGWRDKIDIETTAGQDSIEVGQLKAALQAATPEQLQQFTTLIHAMQAQQGKLGQGEG